MADPQPGAQVAKDKGIYLGQIYGYIKKGLVTNHKVGGYPEGKGIEVDPDEVQEAMSHSRRKGGGPGKGKSGYVRKADRQPKDPGAAAEPTGPKKARRLPAGTIFSSSRGRAANGHDFKPPQFNVGQVLASTGHLTYIDDGDHRVHYGGVQIDNMVYGTERLSMLLAKGIARVERPVHVLGMVLLSFIMDEKLELAQSLEDWMTANELEIHIPEIMDLDTSEDDEESPVRGAVITGDDEDE